MFREMRRKRQQLSPEETEAVLDRCSSGTLAVLGDDGYPYAVPLSYVRHEGRIYFHCAKSGHKLDAIRACDKVCFFKKLFSQQIELSGSPGEAG